MKVALISLFLVSIWVKASLCIDLNWPNSESVSITDVSKTLIAKAQELFKVADENGDSILMIGEWNKFQFINKELLGGFDHINTDKKDSGITTTELEAAVQHMEEELFKKADINDDKKLVGVEYTRYQAFHQDWSTCGEKIEKENINELVNNVITVKAFQANQADDKRDELSKAEFQDADFPCKPLMPGFSHVDADGKNDISEEEFKKAIDHFCTAHIFINADQDSDGDVEGNEVTDFKAAFQGLILLSYRRTTETFDSTKVKSIIFNAICVPDFGVADENQDGKLSDAEMESLTIHSKELIAKEHLTNADLYLDSFCNLYQQAVTVPRFTIADRNGDKKLDDKELAQFISMLQAWAPYPYVVGKDSKADDLHHEIISVLTPCYTAADSNYDGCLDEKEKQLLVLPTSLGKVAEKDLGQYNNFVAHVTEELPLLLKKAMGDDDKLSSDDEYYNLKGEFNQFPKAVK